MAIKVTTSQQEAMASEIRTALTFWGKQVQAALDERFGKGRVGYFISIFPYGGKAQISWMSSARAESLCGMLEGLAKHLSEDKSGIVKPSATEIGYFG